MDRSQSLDEGTFVFLLTGTKTDKRTRPFHFQMGPPNGAMGLFWENNTLFFTGDGGLHCYRDENGDLQADGPS